MTIFKKLHESYAAYSRLHEAGKSLLKRKTELLILDITELDQVAALRDDSGGASDLVYTKDGKYLIEWFFLDDEVAITTLNNAMKSGEREHRVKLEIRAGAGDDAVVDYLNDKAKEFKSLEAFMDEVIKGDYDGHKEAGVEFDVTKVLAGRFFSPKAASELPRLRKLPDTLEVKDLRSILANGQFGFLAAQGSSSRLDDVLKEIEGLMSHRASVDSYHVYDLTTAAAVYSPRNGVKRNIKINLALR